MLLNVVAPAIELLAPLNITLYVAVPAAADKPVVAVTLPLKVILEEAVLSLKVIVAALTVLENVVPFD